MKVKGFENAKRFLNDIKQGDNVLLVHHDDLDGFASGILLYNFCLKKEAKVSHVTQGHGDNFDFELFKDSNKIIFCDLSKKSISDILDKCLLFENKILYIDHHQFDGELDERIIGCYVADGKYFPASRIVDELIGEDSWWGIVGTLSDVGYKYSENNEYINSFLDDKIFDLDWFLINVVYVLSDVINYFHKEKDKAFDILFSIDRYDDLSSARGYSEEIRRELEKQRELYKTKAEKLGVINYFHFESRFPIKGYLLNDLSMKYTNKIFIFVSSKDNGKLSVSARLQDDSFDMPKLLKFALSECTDAKSGGHKRAAGAQFKKEDLEKFKEKLRSWKE